MRKLIIGGTALAVVALTGCAQAQQRAEDILRPPSAIDLVEADPRPAVVTITAGTTETVDVDPPQRLDVRYVGSDGIEEAFFQDDCDHSGGELVWSTEFVEYGEFVCRGGR